MFRTSLLLCVSFVLAGFSTFASHVPAQEADLIPWARDFREAADTATRERKLILLHFWSDDCPPCRRVEANVFTRGEVAAATSAAFVPVKVHVEKSPELARRYQVTRWPTDVIVNPAGLEVYRTVSPQEPQKYVAMLTEVAARSGSQLARNLPPPAVDPLRNAVENANAKIAPAGNFQGGPYQPKTVAQTTTNPPPDAPAYNVPPVDPYANRAIANPYAVAAVSSPNQPQPQPTTNVANGGDYGGDYAPGGPAADPTGIAGDKRCFYSTDQAMQNNPPANPAGALPPPPNFANDPAQPPAREAMPPREVVTPPAANSSLANHAPPAGLPPLGMEGYCVVTLSEGAAWKKGDRRYGAIHRGKLYLFTGAEEQKKFLADPDRYSPALSGFDPVQFTEAGKLTDGKRAHGLTYNNQMFLFIDEPSLQKFQTDPRKYSETVYQAMLRSNSGNTKVR